MPRTADAQSEPFSLMPRTADHPTHNPSWSAVQRLSQRPTAYVLQPLQRTQVPIAAAAPSSGAGKTRGQHGSIPHSGSIPTTRLDPALWLDPDNTARSRGSEVAVAEPLSLSWERPLVRPSRLPGPLQGLFERGAALRMLVSVAGTCRQEYPIMSPFALVLWTPPTSQRERVRPSREPPMTWTYPSSIADQEERLNWSAGHAMQHPTPSYQRSLLPWQLCVLRPCRGSCLLCPQGWPSRRVARVASRSKLRVAPSR